MTPDFVRSFVASNGWKLFEHSTEEDPIDEARYWSWRDRNLTQLEEEHPETYASLMAEEQEKFSFGLDLERVLA